jgi:hypothetical protein
MFGTSMAGDILVRDVRVDVGGGARYASLWMEDGEMGWDGEQRHVRQVSKFALFGGGVFWEIAASDEAEVVVVLVVVARDGR